MLNSTAHWQPLVNGYSDHIPADFRESAPVLGTFPSDHAFDDLRARRVRYIAIHRGRNGYGRVEGPRSWSGCSRTWSTCGLSLTTAKWRSMKW